MSNSPSYSPSSPHYIDNAILTQGCLIPPLLILDSAKYADTNKNEYNNYIQ
jgi:hypothetical protein